MSRVALLPTRTGGRRKEVGGRERGDVKIRIIKWHNGGGAIVRVRLSLTFDSTHFAAAFLSGRRHWSEKQIIRKWHEWEEGTRRSVSKRNRHMIK